MDAGRAAVEFAAELDLPGVNIESLDVHIEDNDVTIGADRARVSPAEPMLTGRTDADTRADSTAAHHDLVAA